MKPISALVGVELRIRQILEQSGLGFGDEMTVLSCLVQHSFIKHGCTQASVDLWLKSIAEGVLE